MIRLPMVRYVLTGFVIFLVCAIIFAPAGLIDRVIDNQPGVALTDTRGTLWQGTGNISVEVNRNTQLNGTLSWDFNWLSLISLAPTYQWTLSRSDVSLSGTAGVTTSGQVMGVQGNLEAAVLNEFLAIYYIVLSGDFSISPSKILRAHHGQITDIQGQIDWSGGRVRYTLAGILHEAQLPAMTAYLEPNASRQPAATVFAQGGSTPLIIASIGENGFVKVGMTKLFTKLLRTPWPGSDPDHAVVLEVEEQLL